MQFKTPVIAYAAGGTADFVVDNKNGVVIAELDETVLASRLERILSDEKLSKQLGSEARKTIEHEYSWDKIFEKILAVYNATTKNIK